MFDKKVDYFMAVVEEGSFSSAARKFMLSQPAISQQVALLEQELSVPLLDRSGYRPKLTEKGQVYYETCVKLKKMYEEMLQDLQKESRRLRIGLSGIGQNKALVQIMNEFKQEYPDISLDIVGGNFDSTVTDLKDGRTDLAFGLEEIFRKERSLQYRVLFQYRMCMACSPNHPLAAREFVEPKDLRKEKFVILSRNNGLEYYRIFMRAFRQDGGNLSQIVKEEDSIEDLMFDVYMNDGIAILSEDVINEEYVKAVPLKSTHHQSRYVMAWKDGYNAQVRKFIKKTMEFFQII